ncbi:MAG: sugar transferase [Ruthenibacterium lactatiformans]
MICHCWPRRSGRSPWSKKELRNLHCACRQAGLIGYAQVAGKYNTTPYDKLQMDLMYIAHPSIIEDFKIVFATVKILFMPESTEGIAEGATTALGHEKTNHNDRMTV